MLYYWHSTLLGIDANKNGIRDDIDVWIEKNTKDDKDLNVFLTNYAKELSEILKVEVFNEVSSKDVYRRINAQISCMVILGSGSHYLPGNEPTDLKNRLESMIFNNPLRALYFKIFKVKYFEHLRLIVVKDVEEDFKECPQKLADFDKYFISRTIEKKRKLRSINESK